MSDNRYAPPAAPVRDIPVQSQMIHRPREVVLAVRLALINYALGLVIAVPTWQWLSQFQSLGALITSQIVNLGIVLWLYGKVHAGRNWARITVLVWFLLFATASLTPVAWNILMSAPVLAKAQSLVSLGLNLAILWLLFFSPGREWFAKRAG